MTPADDLAFKHDGELLLDTPPGGVCSPIIKIEMTPKGSGCLIYGTQRGGDMGCLEVRGSKDRLNLPFCEPKIFVKYLLGLETIEITTVG